MLRFLILSLTLLFASLAPVSAQAAPAQAPDPTTAYFDFMRDRQGYSWRLASRGQGVTTLELTSQRWKDSTWKHDIAIYQPQKLRYPDAAAMFLATKRLPFDDEMGRLAADRIGAPFVIVYDVPNQPLWNRSDDDLFGYTVAKSVETEQSDWALAFPMAKTAVRAMDAVDVYNATSREAETRPVKRWLQIGFSQRGLAAWLASTDPRVAGLVSIGYNAINSPQQEKAQLADWGELSPLLAPRFPDGVREAMQKPRVQALINAWDPYGFRARLNKPKLVINATGDESWSLRAFDQYAGDLPGTTNLLMVPNVGHDMTGAFAQVIEASASWCNWALSDQPLPQPVLTRSGNNWSLEAPGAQAALLYWAWSESDDFRAARWENRPMRKTSGGIWEAATPKASEGKTHLAVFALGNWQSEQQSLPLSSRVVIGE